MEQKKGKPSEDGTTVSPATEAPETVGGGASAEDEATGPAERSVNEGPPGGAGKRESAPAKDDTSAEFQGEADRLDEVKVEPKGKAELQKEDGGKEETNSELKEAEGKETTLASENQMADEKEAKPGSREKANVNDEAKAEPKQAAGEQEANTGGREATEEEAKAGGREATDKEEVKAGGGEATGKEEATTVSQEENDKTEEPKAEAQDKACAPEAKPDSQKKAAMEEEAKAEPQEEEEMKEELVREKEERREEAPTGVPSPPGSRPLPALFSWESPVFPLMSSTWGGAVGAPGCLPGLSEALTETWAAASPHGSCWFQEPGSPDEEQNQGVEGESEEGAGVPPSSPEEWPESPTEEGGGPSPDGLSPIAEASGETSPSASESSPSDVPQSPTEPPPSQEKKKERAPERRVSAPVRPRGPRAQNRKAIVDKFGGAASGPTALFRNTKAAGAAIGGVKNMLLEWCRAMTRNYEHVDIQNFSSSWSSGMAFCALIHKFFPDAFDYAELDPTKRRHNFTLAFSTAEKLADCAQLLEVDDMVRLAVPDSKCVYTYIQELYRSLVQKGLVKTKKK
uniref:Calponin-homology (CH) domain-containing protein n=1 Tax=Sus scrofa TaxID=9823 RepID=A0A8D0TI97_PIG